VLYQGIRIPRLRVSLYFSRNLTPNYGLVLLLFITRQMSTLVQPSQVVDSARLRLSRSKAFNNSLAKYCDVNKEYSTREWRDMAAEPNAACNLAHKRFEYAIKVSLFCTVLCTEAVHSHGGMDPMGLKPNPQDPIFIQCFDTVAWDS